MKNCLDGLWFEFGTFRIKGKFYRNSLSHTKVAICLLLVEMATFVFKNEMDLSSGIF